MTHDQLKAIVLAISVNTQLLMLVIWLLCSRRSSPLSESAESVIGIMTLLIIPISVFLNHLIINLGSK